MATHTPTTHSQYVSHHSHSHSHPHSHSHSHPLTLPHTLAHTLTLPRTPSHSLSLTVIHYLLPLLLSCFSCTVFLQLALTSVVTLAVIAPLCKVSRFQKIPDIVDVLKKM